MASGDRSPRESDGVRRLEMGWPTNGVTWSNRDPRRLAVGSMLEDYRNIVAVVDLDDRSGSLQVAGSFEHYYPPTRIKCGPPGSGDASGEPFATSGDYLRLWTLADGPPPEVGPADASAPGATAGTHTDQAEARATAGDQNMSAAAQAAARLARSRRPVAAKLRRVFHRAGDSEFCAPLTSFDWNQEAPESVATCSIDTTVTVWDLTAEKVAVQLIAHDSEVFDVCRAYGPHLFATGGRDGSVRVFDLRRMESCSVVYEAPQRPVLRVAWSRHDPHYIAAVTAESAEVVLFDVRSPAVPVGHLAWHTGPVNAVQWAPQVSSFLSSAAEDRTALISRVDDLPAQPAQPMLTYEAPAEVNDVAWSALDTQYLAVTCATGVQTLLL